MIVMRREPSLDCAFEWHHECVYVFVGVGMCARPNNHYYGSTNEQKKKGDSEDDSFSDFGFPL